MLPKILGASSAQQASTRLAAAWLVLYLFSSLSIRKGSRYVEKRLTY